MNIREQMANQEINFRQNVISGLGATRTLNENETGSLVLLDRASGIVITLPTTPKAGTFFDFMVSVTCTSNAYKVITGSAPELIVGDIFSCATDNSNAQKCFPSLVATGNISVNMNGSTQGGVKGDTFRLTCLNTTTWIVEGSTNGNSTPVTPFATS